MLPLTTDNRPAELPTAILVDDEPAALAVLSHLLTNAGLAEVLATASNVDTALSLIQQHKPDILFLDINMPVKNGFDLVTELRTHETQPTVVFVTAYNEYAIEAIRHAAFDFLMKPLMEDDLAACIDRYKLHSEKLSLNSKLNLLFEKLNTQRLKFNTRTGFFYLNQEDILYLQAEGAYTELFCTDGTQKMLTTGMGTLERSLPVASFVRINRSVMVNRQYIQEVNRGRNRCFLKYHGQTFEFDIPKRYIRILDANHDAG